MIGASTLALTSLLFGLAQAGTVVWTGDFDYYTSPNDLNNWSWSNEVGEYQYYIHGSENVTSYIAFDPSYRNPGISGESNGLKLSIDQTSTWNSAFWRTELIPQTTANLGTGQMYYHFSLSHSTVNTPNTAYEHQVLFFESHFTEMKIGVGTNGSQLSWCIQSTPQLTFDWTPGVWYNFAYDIDFTAGTVGLWGSTGSNPLVRLAANSAASTSTNSEDWHVGVLAFDVGTFTEDWYISGVYIESGTLTTSLLSGGLTVGGSPVGSTGSTTTTSTSSKATTTTTTTSTSSTRATTTTTSTTTSKASTTTTTTASTSTSTATQTEYGQCGGIGWTGPTVCASPYVCTYGNAYYSQCLPA
ncbi:hypothetical protein FRB95_004676 [Tulasnella sp. JGI-2019a]|nr:hypothetical protein FRB93_009697 [Tulasnella sp. JGI-2019a]KAG9029973.1 hypothetical protein FRB95_004676 [Tulasnella sp. JGI-2019a]